MMKKNTKTCLMLGLAAATAVVQSGMASGAFAANYTRLNNGSFIDTAAAWKDDVNNPSLVAPGANDTLIWDSTSSTGQQFIDVDTVNGGTFAVGGIQIKDTTALVSFSGLTSTPTRTLQLGAGGIDMSLATQNLTIGVNAYNMGMSFAADQVWDVASGRTLAIYQTTNVAASSYKLTKTGAGILQFNSSSGHTGGIFIEGGSVQLVGAGPSSDRFVTSSNLTLGSASATGNLSLRDVSQTFAGLYTSGQGGSITGGSGSGNGGVLTVNIAANTTNTFDGTIGSTVANDARMSMVKTGAGLLNLTGTVLPNRGVTISNGVLRAGATTVQLYANGTTSTAGARLLLNGGVLELGATGTDFDRILTSTATANGVQFAGDGGFSAYGGPRTAKIRSTSTNSAAITLNWNTTANFLTTGSRLLLGSPYANNTVTFVNNINLNGAERTVHVVRGTDLNIPADGVLSGVLSGTDGALVKTGNGILQLTNTNTYTGATRVSEGTLWLGSTGTVGNSPAFDVAAGAVLTKTGDLALPASTTLAVGSASSGLVSATGELGFNGSAVFAITGTYGSGGTWDLFDFATQSTDFASVALSGSYTGSLSKTGQLWTGTVGLQDWSFNEANGVLTVAAVPEPASLALVGLAGLGLLRRRR